MDEESPERILARNWAILGGLRKALKDESLGATQREELAKLASMTEATIEALQRNDRKRPMIRNVATGIVALNGAALGAAIAVIRIIWRWTSPDPFLSYGFIYVLPEPLRPYISGYQVIYVITVFWFAIAGAVIFVVARNVLNSISRK